MIVVHASALLEVFLRTPAAQAVDRGLSSGIERGCTRRTSSISEVAQILRRSTSAELETERGRMALADLADFPIRRYPHGLFLTRVWDLRNNFTAYDAVYVALAEALDAPLLTRDQRLAAAAGHHARVELV